MINKRGYWEDNTADNHKHDASLNDKLISFFKENNIESILDLGCGTGEYAIRFINNDISCDCFDGNPNTPILTDNLCGVADLSSEFNLSKTYDCVLSLEVGEHIPKEYERVFIENIIRHSKNLIIISWAIVGQGGWGHFNERPNSYIESILIEYGFDRDIHSEKTLRESSDLWWFKNTIMVFKK